MYIVSGKFFDYIIVTILVFPFQYCAKGQSTSPSSPTAKYTKLVWQDEFDNPGLPDPAKWKYDTGFIANHELQYYTYNRTENAL
jgi:hypothetical protein